MFDRVYLRIRDFACIFFNHHHMVVSCAMAQECSLQCISRLLRDQPGRSLFNVALLPTLHAASTSKGCKSTGHGSRRRTASQIAPSVVSYSAECMLESQGGTRNEERSLVQVKCEIGCGGFCLRFTAI